MPTTTHAEYITAKNPSMSRANARIIAEYELAQIERKLPHCTNTNLAEMIEAQISALRCWIAAIDYTESRGLCPYPTNDDYESISSELINAQFAGRAAMDLNGTLYTIKSVASYDRTNWRVHSFMLMSPDRNQQDYGIRVLADLLVLFDPEY